MSGKSPVETSTTAAGADVGAADSGADELLPGDGVEVCDDALDAVEVSLLDPHPAAITNAATDMTMALLTAINVPSAASPVASAQMLQPKCFIAVVTSVIGTVGNARRVLLASKAMGRVSMMTAARA